MNEKTIIVVGGALGGRSAVTKARQFNEKARIILAEQSPQLFLNQARLQDLLMAEEESLLSHIRTQEEYFMRKYNVDVRRNTKACLVDVDSRCLVVECQGQQERIAFDSLVYAGGSECISLDVDGLYGDRVVNFRKLRDIHLIKQALREGAKNALVVGCGLYGVEAALSLQKVGLKVTVIEAKKRIMPKYSLQFAHTMLSQLKDCGISVKLSSTIESAKELLNASFAIELSDGETIDADLVVVCVGLKPCTSLLEAAGAALDPEGLIRIDDQMATTLPHIFACGSVVGVPYAVTGERKWIPQPAVVHRTAQIAGHNAAIFDDSKMDSVRSFCGSLITKVGSISFARTGLNEFEAHQLLGDDNVFVTTVFGSESATAKYAQDMCVRLLVDSKNKRIIGGEVFGEQGVERRIDLLSVAVAEGWTPGRLMDIDMAHYADGGATFDALKDAANRANIILADSVKSLSVERLASWIKNDQDFRLVDVSDVPLLAGRIPKKAIHLPLEAMRERLSELSDQSSPIVLCSKSGRQSYLAQQALTQRGINNVYHLDGGIASFDLVAAQE